MRALHAGFEAPLGMKKPQGEVVKQGVNYSATALEMSTSSLGTSSW